MTIYKKGTIPIELHMQLRKEYKEEFPDSFAAGIRCPNEECRSLPREQEMRNYDLMWGDADIYCLKCGSFVRYWDRD